MPPDPDDAALVKRLRAPMWRAEPSDIRRLAEEAAARIEQLSAAQDGAPSQELVRALARFFVAVWPDKPYQAADEGLVNTKDWHLTDLGRSTVALATSPPTAPDTAQSADRTHSQSPSSAQTPSATTET